MAGGGKRRPGKNKTRHFVSPLPISFPGRNLVGSAKSASRLGSSDRVKASASYIATQRLTGNAFSYDYPAVDLQEGLHSESCDNGNTRDSNLDESCSIVLVNSNETPIVAFVDPTASKESISADFTYDYSSSFVLDGSSHTGLGFCDKLEATSSCIGSSSKKIEEQQGSSSGFSPFSKKIEAGKHMISEVGSTMAVDVPTDSSSPERNDGFLSIGGMKLYTQDIYEEESEEEDAGELLDDGGSESSESGKSTESSESGCSEDMSDSSSDIDEGVAEDYLEGIGGSDEILDSRWLVDKFLYVSDDDGSGSGSSSSNFDETTWKFGGMALQDASREYGLKKSQSRKKNSTNSCKSGTPANHFSSALDDIMLVKDPRMFSGKKKPVARFPQSWPLEAQKSKNFRKFPGEKKKHRKELIAVKRRERMIRRGVDLEQINLKLKQMVLDEVDMLSFQPMHSRDCSQVRRLAAIYHLRSGCQGSGKKSFVTVTRTEHTCMPSSSDNLRLEKLIGACNLDADFAVNENPNIKFSNRNKNRLKKARRRSGLSPVEQLLSTQGKSYKKLGKHHGSSEASGKKQGGKISSSYASQPVSFVSSGIMQPDTVEIGTSDSLGKDDTNGENEGVGSDSKVGSFEVHTKGFGSKMMAKMGFVEGGGLGKDGQGVLAPIEVIKRPKSLGLGVEFSETSGDSCRKESQRIGAFEKHASGGNSARKDPRRFGGFEQHTKGFGSKMMVKMGFVEGMGLGKDLQGIVNPLVAVRLPKSRGLGSEG